MPRKPIPKLSIEEDGVLVLKDEGAYWEIKHIDYVNEDGEVLSQIYRFVDGNLLIGSGSPRRMDVRLVQKVPASRKLIGLRTPEGYITYIFDDKVPYVLKPKTKPASAKKKQGAKHEARHQRP